MHVSAGVHMAMCVGGGQEGKYLGVILSFYSSIWGLTAGTFTCWATSCPVLWFWCGFLVIDEVEIFLYVFSPLTMLWNACISTRI